jgi:glucan phosphoethanolaminetransferase (alkaline phosphatase superfamily)
VLLTNSTKNVWKYIEMFPIIIISFIIAGIELRSEPCFNMGSAILVVLLIGVFVVVLFITLSFQILRLAQKQNIKYRSINILITLFLAFFTSWTFYIPNDFFQEKPILKAEIEESNDIGRLTLRENNQYSVQFGHIDWVCTKNGKFRIRNLPTP